MNQPRTICFLIEHKDRERDAIRAIASQLATTHGITSHLLSIPFHTHQLFLKPAPDVIVVPFALDQNDWPLRLVRELYGDTIPIVNISWEQLLSHANKLYKMPRDTYTRKTLHYVAWNPTFKTWLTEAGVPDTHIRICGNPNVEQLELAARNQADIRSRLDQNIPLHHYEFLCFFPMNYGWAFLPDAEIENRVARGYNPTYAQTYRDIAQKSLKKFLRFTFTIARNHPDTLFVIRPHPGITIAQYQNAWHIAVGKPVPPNIRFDKSLTARDWVCIADIVGTSWSSVCLDAWETGKPAFLFQPYPLPDWLRCYWMDAIPVINDENAYAQFTATSNSGQAHSKPHEYGPFSTQCAAWFAELARTADPQKHPANLSRKTWQLVLRFFARGIAARAKLKNRWLNADYFRPEKISPGTFIPENRA